MTVKCKIQLVEIIIFTKATVVKTTEPGLTWPEPAGLKVGPRPDLAQWTRRHWYGVICASLLRGKQMHGWVNREYHDTFSWRTPVTWPKILGLLVLVSLTWHEQEQPTTRTFMVSRAIYTTFTFTYSWGVADERCQWRFHNLVNRADHTNSPASVSYEMIRKKDWNQVLNNWSFTFGCTCRRNLLNAYVYTSVSDALLFSQNKINYR